MKRIIIFPALMFIAGVAFSQANTATLNKKWDNMLDNAESYQFYKVIKKSELDDLRKIIQDSLNRLKNELIQEKNLVKEQRAQITQLQKQNNEVKANLERINKEKNNMGFLGIDVNKYTYTFILWFIIVLVLIGCAILFSLFYNSNNISVQKIKESELLSKTLDEYKYSKIEMERKLKREMQTYINKIEELKNK